MSLKNRSIRLLVLTVSATAMLLPGASLAQAGALKAPPGDAFYTASAKQIKAGKPGSVIWSREVKKTANGRVALPSASKTILVLYRSLDPKGNPIAVSGTIDLPKGKAPKGGFKSHLLGPRNDWRCRRLRAIAQRCRQTRLTATSPTQPRATTAGSRLDTPFCAPTTKGSARQGRTATSSAPQRAAA